MPSTSAKELKGMSCGTYPGQQTHMLWRFLWKPLPHHSGKAMPNYDYKLQSRQMLLCKACAAKFSKHSVRRIITIADQHKSHSISISFFSLTLAHMTTLYNISRQFKSPDDNAKVSVLLQSPVYVDVAAQLEHEYAQTHASNARRTISSVSAPPIVHLNPSMRTP